MHAPLERLFQGPVADALTHVGQLAMMRRTGGVPDPRGELLCGRDCDRASERRLARAGEAVQVVSGTADSTTVMVSHEVRHADVITAAKAFTVSISLTAWNMG